MGIAGILLFTAGMWAQTATPLSLSTLTRKAGMIFAGEVIRVERAPPIQAGGEAAMQVTFRVTQAVRGTRLHQTVLLREWEGLWRHRGEHYRVGEHVMLFLHRSNREGLTSPVGGRSGRFDIDRQNNVVLRPEQAKMIANTLPAKAVTIKPAAPKSASERRVTPTVRYPDFIRIVREAAMR
jgi:hypothetical protein